jgi:hypothetical protein
MKPGTYSYVISKSGYITQRAEFTIQDNAVIDVNMQKVPKYNVTFNTKSTPTGADTASNVDITKYL